MLTKNQVQRAAVNTNQSDDSHHQRHVQNQQKIDDPKHRYLWRIVQQYPKPNQLH